MSIESQGSSCEALVSCLESPQSSFDKVAFFSRNSKGNFEENANSSKKEQWRYLNVFTSVLLSICAQILRFKRTFNLRGLHGLFKQKATFKASKRKRRKTRTNQNKKTENQIILLTLVFQICLFVFYSYTLAYLKYSFKRPLCPAQPMKGSGSSSRGNRNQ